MSGKPNRSGRKPGPGGKRTRRVVVLLTNEEFRNLALSSAMEGLSLSEALAAAARRLTGAVLTPIPEAQELGGAGNG